MTIGTLITATPWNATTAAAVTVRLAGGGSKPYNGLNGQADWMAGVVDPVRFSAGLQVDQNGPTGGAFAQFAQIAFYASLTANRDRLAGYNWIGCPVTILSYDDAASPIVYTLIQQGVVSAFDCTDDRLSLTLTDLSVDLGRPVLIDTFAGTGGIEGDAGVAGRFKRLSFGRCFNVEGRILKLATNVWEFGDPARPIQSFDVVRDKGRAGTPVTTVAWAGSIAATLAALEAVTPGSGGYAAAPSINCVRWWTQPSGPLTADIKGIVGAGYVETAPAIAAQILTARSTMTVSNTAAMVAIRPGEAGIHCGDESETIANVFDRLLTGVSLGWVVNADGTVRLAPFTWVGPVETLMATSIARKQTFKPIGKRRLGYNRNYRVQNAGEISAAVLDGEVDLLGNRGGNMVLDPQFAQGFRYWFTSSANVFVEHLNGAPLSGWAHFFASGNYEFATSNNDVPVDLNGAKAIYLSAWGYIASGTVGNARAVVQFFDLNKTLIIESELSLLGPPYDQWYGRKTTAIIPPANAVSCRGYLNAQLSAGFANLGGLRVDRTSDAADVTAETVPSLTVKTAFTITGNYQGTPDAGQLTYQFNAVRKLGTADVSSSTAWSLLNISGCSASIDANGLISVTAITGNGGFKVRSIRDGVTIDQDVASTFQLSAAPVAGGGAGGSGTGNSASITTYTSNSQTTYAAVSAIVGIKSGSTGVVSVSAPLYYRAVDKTTQGGWQVAAKFIIRIVGGGFVDMGAEVTGDGNARVTNEPPLINYSGSININQSYSGLTPNTNYEVQMVARRVDGPVKGLTFSGTSSIAGT